MKVGSFNVRRKNRIQNGRHKFRPALRGRRGSRQNGATRSRTRTEPKSYRRTTRLLVVLMPPWLVPSPASATSDTLRTSSPPLTPLRSLRLLAEFIRGHSAKALATASLNVAAGLVNGAAGRRRPKPNFAEVGSPLAPLSSTAS